MLTQMPDRPLEASVNTKTTNTHQIMDEQDALLATKYRPRTLDQLIGHEKVVTRVKGMLASGKIPSALLITGPSSAGKTTLARAMAAEINGKPADKQSDLRELNGADQRSIEDMRELIKLSKFKPQGKKRIFIIDECQQILSNAAAASALLKPMEDSGRTDTIWVLCSMDPSKFTSTQTGKAIANRCVQLVLEPHTDADLMKQAKRIVKGEEMGYLRSTELIQKIIEKSNSEMRTLANLIQSVRDYYEGLDKKPKLLDEAAIASVLAASEDSEEKLVQQVIVGALTGKFAQVQLALLEVSDGFQFLNKLLWASGFLVSNAALNGRRHPKVWATSLNKSILEALKESKVTFGQYAGLQECLVNTKITASSFAIGIPELISARIYRYIKDAFAASNKSKE